MVLSGRKESAKDGVKISRIEKSGKVDAFFMVSRPFGEELELLQIAVCDEEASVRDYLEKLIQKTVACEVGFFSSGKELLEAGREFDILFLEIRADKYKRIELAERFGKEKGSLVIFISSELEYVFDAFDVDAFHYLLKPLDESKVKNVLQRAIDEIKQREEREPLVIRSHGRYRNIEKKKILYAENVARKVVLHLEQEKVEYYAKMDELERMLGRQFFRCHRGYLVNLGKVKSYEAGTVLLKNGECILMAKQKYHDFSDAYREYLRSSCI